MLLGIPTPAQTATIQPMSQTTTKHKKPPPTMEYEPPSPIPMLTPERIQELTQQKPESQHEIQLRQQEQKRKFCDRYAVNANFTEAAKFAKLEPREIYSWLRLDQEFKEQYEAAKTRALDRLQGVLWEQAEKNPLLLMFTLKRHIPEYRDSFKIDVQHSVNDSSLDLSKLSTSELELFLELQRKASSVDVIDVVSHVLEDSIDT
jgi:hypothetical protein